MICNKLSGGFNGDLSDGLSYILVNRCSFKEDCKGFKSSNKYTNTMNCLSYNKYTIFIFISICDEQLR